MRCFVLCAMEGAAIQDRVVNRAVINLGKRRTQEHDISIAPFEAPIRLIDCVGRCVNPSDLRAEPSMSNYGEQQTHTGHVRQVACPS